MVRAKFLCVEKGSRLDHAIQRDENGEPKYSMVPQVPIYFKPVYGGSEENLRFANATSPDGKLFMKLLNPQAAEYFEPGVEYYLDFTRADQQ
jgi:hypothetical protein